MVKIVEFAQETKREIMKVTWPARRETVMTTVMILIMALAAGVFFLGVDSFLGFAISRLLSMSS
jgi:preprotein translocase subunit SecE